MHKTYRILLVAALLALVAGCGSHTPQGAVSTSAKDWQKTPPSAGYLAFMRGHPMGPPSMHGGPPKGAPAHAATPASH